MFKFIKDKLSRHLMVQYVVTSIFSWIVFFILQFIISIAIPLWVFDSNFFTPFWEMQCENAIWDIQNAVTENHRTVEEVQEYTLSDIRHESVAFYFCTDDVQKNYGRFTNAQVICSDGIFYPKKYIPSNAYWKYWNYVGIFVAFFFSEIIILRYIYKLICRMRKLYNQVSSSDVNRKNSVISIEGRDEISLLGEKVEYMRTKLIQCLDDEKNQKEQQKELISALSHDIRTPLTKIITCLDILNYKLTKSEEERENCINMITSNANQLKSLTDTLLNSVAGESKDSIYQKELYDGPSMLSQLLFEGSYYLEEEGFEVHLPKTVLGDYQLYVDIVAMRRLADNLYSNLQKYADQKYPIEIWMEESDKEVTVYVQNHKKIELCETQQESYGIGLVTIKQILEAMGGRSARENTEQIFTVKLVLPKHDATINNKI